jgi:hypothetical protein
MPLPAVTVSMPHGRRSDRLNERDLEVLGFIARYGNVPRSTVATWSGSGRSVAYAREHRLWLAGLVRLERGHQGERILLATRQGLKACGRPELTPARPAPATFYHEALVARLGARLESEGAHVLSEREILARERAEGKRIFSAALGHGRFHRADLLRLAGEGAEAIEVELTVKGAARLDGILRAWRFAIAERRFDRVIYHGAPRTRRFVEQAITRTATTEMINAVDLQV